MQANKNKCKQIKQMQAIKNKCKQMINYLAFEVGVEDATNMWAAFHVDKVAILRRNAPTILCSRCMFSQFSRYQRRPHCAFALQDKCEEQKKEEKVGKLHAKYVR